MFVCLFVCVFVCCLFYNFAIKEQRFQWIKRCGLRCNNDDGGDVHWPLPGRKLDSAIQPPPPYSKSYWAFQKPKIRIRKQKNIRVMVFLKSSKNGIKTPEANRNCQLILTDTMHPPCKCAINNTWHVADQSKLAVGSFRWGSSVWFSAAAGGNPSWSPRPPLLGAVCLYWLCCQPFLFYFYYYIFFHFSSFIVLYLIFVCFSPHISMQFSEI